MPNPLLASAPRAKSAEGLAVAPSRAGDVLLPEKAALEMLGGVSFMWIRRRLLLDPSFPNLVRVGRRRFYWRGDLLRWLGSPEAARPLHDPRTSRAGGS
jgi:hypothetical protein